LQKPFVSVKKYALTSEFILIFVIKKFQVQYMDNLKSAIADKVLEVSSLSSDDMKLKLEKISRFRDFVNACQSLIQKYPAIETELLRMVENDDFDTRIASSRVDTVIRLSENNQVNSTTQTNTVEKDISELEEITDQLPMNKITDCDTVTDEEITSHTAYMDDEIKDTENKDILRKTIPVLDNKEEEKVSQPEDIDYEEVDPLGIEPANEEKEKQYVDFEEVADTETEEDTDSVLEQAVHAQPQVTPTIQSEPSVAFREPEITTKSSIKPHNGAVKETAKRGLQVIIVIAVILALIFLIVFIIKNTELFLWGFGITLVVIAIVWYLIKRKKGGDAE